MPTVLVVEDSPVDRRLVEELLAPLPGLTVQFAAHTAEAELLLAQQPPDLVLTDLMMPEMAGLELLTTVRSRFPGVPVILITSMGSEELAVEALRRGAASYVPKRRLTRDLLSTVESVLATVAHQRMQGRLRECLARSEFAFVLHNDSTLFHPLIEFVQAAVGQMGLCDEADQTRLGVALEEALANALYHGNLEVSSQLREENDAAYHTLVAERRQQPPYRDRRIAVEVSLTRRQAVFTIRDEGRGFDPSTLPDPTDPSNLEKVSGRGVLLMRSFMDEVRYNDLGNVVTLVKNAARHG